MNVIELFNRIHELDTATDIYMFTDKIFFISVDLLLPYGRIVTPMRAWRGIFNLVTQYEFLNSQDFVIVGFIPFVNQSSSFVLAKSTTSAKK